MPDRLPNYRNLLTYAASRYRDAAERLADAIEADPDGIHLGEHAACSGAWNALVEAGQLLRAQVFVGDSIDDYYQQTTGGDDV